MTDWPDLEARMDAATFRVFAVDAEIQPANGLATYAARAIVTPDARVVGEGGYLEVRSEIQVHKDDAAQPAKGDLYTVDGTAWRVDRYEPKGARWILIVRKG